MQTILNPPNKNENTNPAAPIIVANKVAATCFIFGLFIKKDTSFINFRLVATNNQSSLTLSDKQLSRLFYHRLTSESRKFTKLRYFAN